MSAPAILADIKADLGITDNANDAWLQRRIDAVWARMEVYTSRSLCVPPKTFVDDWGQISGTAVVHALPPAIMHPPRGSVFLRCFPVVSIETVELDGQALDAQHVGAVSFDRRTGKLFTIRGDSVIAEDLSQELRGSRARVTYKAGWATVPADLYEIVLGAVQHQWAAKNSGGVAGVTGNVTGINVQDVGSIELSEGNLFVTSAAKSGSDPLLGPYANMLDHYIDWRVRIGNEGQQTTIVLGETPGSMPTTPITVHMLGRAIDAQAIDIAPTAMLLDAPLANVGGYWSQATQQFSPPSGAYQINATLAALSNNANASVTLAIHKNGIEVARADGNAPMGEMATATIATAVPLDSGDVVELRMSADRTGMTIDAGGSHFSVLGAPT